MSIGAREFEVAGLNVLKESGRPGRDGDTSAREQGIRDIDR